MSRAALAPAASAILPERRDDDLPPAVLPPEEWTERPFTWLGRAFDRMTLRGMRLAFAAALRPSEADIAAARDSAEPYLDDTLLAEPHRFFAFVDEPPPAAEMRVAQRRPVPDGVIVSREFHTAYAPFHCSGSWPACVENDCIAVEHWMHRPGPPRATVVALHGFTMGTPWIDAHVLMAAHWFALGFDVALVALPFHGPRSPRTARYSGELFGSWDVSRVNEAVRQAVFDVHLVKTWIARETGRPVGLLGLSLGGYITALVAGLCPDLAFAIPLVPPVYLDALAGSLLALEGDVDAPIPLATLRAGYTVHSPLTYPLAIPRERVLIVAARGDCLVPPAHAYALWKHWDEPAIHWYSGSHTAPFHRARIVARIERHLESLRLG